MKSDNLKKGNIYNYQSSTEQVEVMYTGYSFGPSFGWGYGFRAYNEESGKYDGCFNTLSINTVENMISPK